VDCPFQCTIDTSGIQPKDHLEYDAIIWPNNFDSLPSESERKQFVNIYFATESETGVSHFITRNRDELIDLFGSVFDISFSYHLPG